MDASATYMNPAPAYANADRVSVPLLSTVLSGSYARETNLAEASSALSSFLYGKIAAGWELVQPLPVSTEWDSDLCIVSDALFSIYGDGDTEAAARQDYVRSLIEYYQLIEGRARNVSTRALLQKLQRYLRRV